MYQMLRSLWSLGCQGETDCLMMAFQEKFQGFVCHSWNSHAAAEVKQDLLNSDYDLWSHFTKLPDCCLEKGESNVKNSGLLCLKGKEGKCKATCSRTMASSSTGLCSCCPDLLMETWDIRRKHRKKKERGRKLWKVVKNSILGLKIQHFWADRELLGQGRQRNEVVLGSVLRGMWHWEAQWGRPHWTEPAPPAGSPGSPYTKANPVPLGG